MQQLVLVYRSVFYSFQSRYAATPASAAQYAALSELAARYAWRATTRKVPACVENVCDTAAHHQCSYQPKPF